LKQIDEALKLDLDGIKEEIDIRKKLLTQMVGTLYSGIVWGEIEKLSLAGDEKLGKPIDV